MTVKGVQACGVPLKDRHCPCSSHWHMRDVGTPRMLVSFPLLWGSTLTEAVSDRKGLFGLPDQGRSPSWWRSQESRSVKQVVTWHPQTGSKDRWKQVGARVSSVFYSSGSWPENGATQSGWVFSPQLNRPPTPMHTQRHISQGILDLAKLTLDTNCHNVEVTSLLSCLTSKLFLRREKWDGGGVGRLFFLSPCSGIVIEVSGHSSLPWSSLFLTMIFYLPPSHCGSKVSLVLSLTAQSLLWSVVGISSTYDIGLSGQIEEELLWGSLPRHYSWVFPNKSFSSGSCGFALLPTLLTRCVSYPMMTQESRPSAQVHVSP